MQQLVGKYALEKQLRALNLIDENISLNNLPDLVRNYEKYYEKLGDKLSLQYGGSIAHHSSLHKGKGFFRNSIPELITSVKRHWANNFSDSYKQGIV
jgi:hypothetical protein